MSNNILKFNRNNIKQVEELSTHCSEVAEQTWKFISHLKTLKMPN